MNNKQGDRAVLFHIKEAWSQVNYQIFGQSLREPGFSLLDDSRDLGRWNPRDRIISLQYDLVYQSPWLEVVEVLKHEMAHQYLSEVLQIEDESAHGPTFRRVCKERGIIASAQGTLQKDPEVERLFAKVNKLLALAESDNSHEAEQAAQSAQRLLIKHHIKLGQTLYNLEELSRQAAIESMQFRQLGEPKSRHYQYEYSIAQLLSEHFFVSVIWVNGYSVSTETKGRVLEICGRAEDLEVASYVYDFIYNHLKLAWKSYRVKAAAKGLRQRLSFCLGLVQGFISQFERQSAVETAETLELIHIGQSLTQAFIASRYPKTRTSSSSGWSPTGDYHSGYQEGSSLTLKRGIKSEGKSKETRRLGFENPR